MDTQHAGPTPARSSRPWIYLLLTLALGISLLPVAVAPRQASRMRFFPETGFRVEDRFLETWEIPGSFRESVLLNGYPISEAREEVNPVDGRTYRMQWFQRARYELHPEETPPNDVQLGLLGIEATRGREGEPAFAKVPRPAEEGPALYWFPETEHTLRDPFLAFWLAHGSWKQIGFPISEELDEPDTAGTVRRVQYFQRARLELSPTGEITLGLLGVELYRPPPPPPPTP
jgi:hypothetical protein